MIHEVSQVVCFDLFICLIWGYTINIMYAIPCTYTYTISYSMMTAFRYCSPWTCWSVIIWYYLVWIFVSMYLLLFIYFSSLWGYTWLLLLGIQCYQTIHSLGSSPTTWYGFWGKNKILFWPLLNFTLLKSELQSLMFILILLFI